MCPVQVYFGWFSVSGSSSILFSLLFLH
jgi:hypothetical protein